MELLHLDMVAGIWLKLLMMIWIKSLRAGGDAYRRFIHFVAESRSQSPKDIEKIANGRVWIGTKANEIGLVDEIGGIEEAIKYAANMNELKYYQVEYYGDELTYGEKLIKKLHNNSEISQGSQVFCLLLMV